MSLINSIRQRPLILLAGLGLLLLLLAAYENRSLDDSSVEQQGAVSTTEGTLTPLQVPQWSGADLNLLRRLWLANLSGTPSSPSNRFARDMDAAALGKALFFDPAFSAGGDVSCSTCHQPDRFFTDGLPTAQGTSGGSRNTPTLAGVAYDRWFFWNGRKDSLWSQALAPLETAHEHSTTRLAVAHHIAAAYSAEYEALFGPLPDMSDPGRFPAQASPMGDEAAQAAWASMSAADQQAVNQIFANVGKALAAYQRLLLPGPSPFDRYLEVLFRDGARAAEGILTEEELAGLALFIGDGRCTNCHNGPLLDDPFFHNIGLSGQAPGRQEGAPQVVDDPFNCYGPFSDTDPDRCRALNEIQVEGPGLAGAFKTPTLRNVAETGPYMHDGRFATLADVVDHYNEAPSAEIGHSEIQPLNLDTNQLRWLAAFLETLTGELAVDEQWLVP